MTDTNPFKSDDLDPGVKSEIEYYEGLKNDVMQQIKVLRQQRDNLIHENASFEEEIEKVRAAEKEIQQQQNQMNGLDEKINRLESEDREMQNSIKDLEEKINRMQVQQAEKRKNIFSKIFNRKKD